MSDLNLALLFIGGLTLLLSLVAGLLKSKIWFLSEPLAATLLGVLIGPYGFDLLRLERWGDPLTLLEEGSTITATFYDGDPEAGGQVLETLAFTYGEDSEASFADGFANAAEEAALVTVTTEPQTYTVDLSTLPVQDGRAFGTERGFEGPRGRRN